MPIVSSILTYWDQFIWVVSGLWLAVSGVCVLVWRYVAATRKRTDANTQALVLVQKDLTDQKDANDRELQQIRRNCERQHDQLSTVLTRIHERIDEGIKQNHESNQRTQELLIEMLGGRQ